MQKWLEGTVVNQKRWTETLFSLQVEAEVAAFEAGQFAKLALAVEGEMVARPYSFVNAPNERPHEFYYVTLPDGPLTQRLSKLEAGDAIRLAPRPAGFLVLSEIPDGENLWLISTGTGVGPFLSILKSEAPWQRFRQVVLVHAVRHAEELTYRESISRLQYPSSPVRNADFYGGGVGWRRAYVAPMQPVFQVQALLGQEKNDAAPVRDDLSRDLYTLRGGLAQTPAARWGLSAGLSYTRSRFKEADPLFLVTRGDDYYGFDAGVSYRITKKLTLRGDYLHSDNRSNIELYKYTRDLMTFRARYEF